jgi:chromosome partitioning protein
MAITLVTASSKGGAGKTTLARLLLGHALQRGLTVAAIDGDLNGTLGDWCAHIAKHKIDAYHEPDETKILQTIHALQDRDLVVVDCAGAQNQAAIFAIGVGDLVLVPLKLSSADFTEAVKTMRLIRSASMMAKRDIPARLVLTGFKPRTSIAAHVEREIATAGLPLMQTRLNDLVAFEEMTFNGRVPADGIAGLQAANLFSEAMTLSGGATPVAVKLAS